MSKESKDYSSILIFQEPKFSPKMNTGREFASMAGKSTSFRSLIIDRKNSAASRVSKSCTIPSRRKRFEPWGWQALYRVYVRMSDE